MYNEESTSMRKMRNIYFDQLSTGNILAIRARTAFKLVVEAER